ncbi:hypothetical protein Pve01_73200 [Planomonospora venezuelensis]|nr:hypothetical protein Pve01_73200 [Planomonospora venezuelensis]
MLQQIITFMLARRDDERGATATEYALLVAFIAFLIIVGVTAFGGALGGYFTELGQVVTGWDADQSSGS